MRITKRRSCRNAKGDIVNIPYCPFCGELMSVKQDILHHIVSIIDVTDDGVGYIKEDIETECWSTATPWTWHCMNCQWDSEPYKASVKSPCKELYDEQLYKKR